MTTKLQFIDSNTSTETSNVTLTQATIDSLFSDGTVNDSILTLYPPDPPSADDAPVDASVFVKFPSINTNLYKFRANIDEFAVLNPDGTLIDGVQLVIKPSSNVSDERKLQIEYSSTDFTYETFTMNNAYSRWYS